MSRVIRGCGHDRMHTFVDARLAAPHNDTQPRIDYAPSCAGWVKGWRGKRLDIEVILEAGE